MLFKCARPVWPVGKEKEKNRHVGFRSVFNGSGAQNVCLRLTGSTICRVFLNGEFIHHGPARGPHGFYRMDELDLSGQMKDGENLLAIEVVGMNCNSFAYLNQTSFLQAELSVDGKIVAATGGECFEALLLPERIQKVERYSFQRPFVEAYALVTGFDNWRNQLDASIQTVPVTVQETKPLLARGVPVPGFQTLETLSTVSSGTMAYTEKPVDRSGYWWMNDPRYATLESFMPEEFERDLLQIWQACDGSGGNDGHWEIRDLGTNLTGFVRLSVSCKEPVRVIVAFDELLIDGDIDLLRNTALNFIYYELKPGEYELESVEPYTFRYLKILMLDGVAQHTDTTSGGLGDRAGGTPAIRTAGIPPAKKQNQTECVIKYAGIREYANPEATARFESDDPELNQLFEAGRQTFRQNAVDLYMDCPGRERAGWLCDSFFTGRAEKLLCGGSKVERAFLENFLLPQSFGDVPKGMLPMCYPSEHPGGRHIPQWCMWLILELEEYLERTRDREMIDRFGAKVDGIFSYLQKFENSNGLLEKLPSWNFIEWSMANKLTEDVNYPTNMLYACALESTARLYDRPQLADKAVQLHETVRKQSFNGTFFVDNSVRDENGELQPSGECTEVCQYYAFFCGTASLQSHPKLWRYLLEQAGSNRAPDCPLHPANAFIGYYLRMDLLSRFGEGERLLDEMKQYFLGMANRTGTLWERDDERSSCNHGFASFLCVLLTRSAAHQGILF
jgi:alpha-L-rhamnosidase